MWGNWCHMMFEKSVEKARQLVMRYVIAMAMGEEFMGEGPFPSFQCWKMATCVSEGINFASLQIEWHMCRRSNSNSEMYMYVYVAIRTSLSRSAFRWRLLGETHYMSTLTHCELSKILDCPEGVYLHHKSSCKRGFQQRHRVWNGDYAINTIYICFHPRNQRLV